MQACIPKTFTFPTLRGLQHLSTSAVPLNAWMGYPGILPEGQMMPSSGVTACNVTVTYTHPGHDDVVNVQVLLPPEDTWNKRLTASGGSGFSVGLISGDYVALLASQGYAAVTTDGGHDSGFGGEASWAIKSDGNLDYALISNWADRGSFESIKIGKTVVADFYGQDPEYTYFQGCSTGGRQSLAMAQRFPEEVDGIVSGCPGLWFESLAPSLYWPQQIMKDLEKVPSPCELDALHDVAVEACDELDGVRDGVLGRPLECRFEAASVIGREVQCADGSKTRISRGAAQLAERFWEGPMDADGFQLFPGLNKGSQMTGLFATANTKCDKDGHHCERDPFVVATGWLKIFIKKDISFDVESLTLAEYRDFFLASGIEFGGPLSAHPELRRFQAKGGKAIVWHGMDDQTVPMKATRKYYDQIAQDDLGRGVDTPTYLRYFEVAGAAHCGAPPGMPYPMDALAVLRRWVEEGIEPTHLSTLTMGEGGEGIPGCLYPQRLAWNSSRKEYFCETSSGQAVSHDEL